MREMFQLRAWLVESEPEVWRQFVIDPRLTLEQLHTVLQIAFGWQNAHLHQFHEEDGRRYARPNPEDRDVIDERKLQLGQVFDRDQKRIAYEYDFGDSWIHAVELEKKVDGETFDYPSHTFIEGGRGIFSGKPRAAICIAGACNGPPENSGGLDGYFRILDMLEDPKAMRTQEQKDLLEWLGATVREAYGRDSATSSRRDAARRVSQREDELVVELRRGMSRRSAITVELLHGASAERNAVLGFQYRCTQIQLFGVPHSQIRPERKRELQVKTGARLEHQLKGNEQ